MQSNARTFIPVPYDSDKQAMEDVRTGKLDGAIIIPLEYSRRVYEENHPRIALVVDNTDNFMSSTLEQEFSDLTKALNNPGRRVCVLADFDTVELYPYIEYMKYLLPDWIAWAMFVPVMIGGGTLHIDDKAPECARGLPGDTDYQVRTGRRAQYRVAIKAISGGPGVTVLGSLRWRDSGRVFTPQNMLYVFLLRVATSLAFNTMMFLLMVRVEDPLVPRAMFGIP